MHERRDARQIHNAFQIGWRLVLLKQSQRGVRRLLVLFRFKIGPMVVGHQFNCVTVDRQKLGDVGVIGDRLWSPVFLFLLGELRFRSRGANHCRLSYSNGTEGS